MSFIGRHTISLDAGDLMSDNYDAFIDLLAAIYMAIAYQWTLTPYAHDFFSWSNSSLFILL